MIRLKIAPLFFVVLVATTGCRPKHLAYVQDIVVGVDVSVVGDQGKFKLDVGYDRQFYSIVPRKGDKESDEAVSVVSASRIKVQGLETFQFGHVIATGDCAVKMAKNPHDMGDLVTNLLGSASAK